MVSICLLALAAGSAPAQTGGDNGQTGAKQQSQGDPVPGNGKQEAGSRSGGNAARRGGKPPTQQPESPAQPRPKGEKPLPGLSPAAVYDRQGEETLIAQHLFPFHSPYEGPNSLASRSETEVTSSTTLYLGVRVVQGVEVYVNPEIAVGNGFSAGGGLGAFTDGDLIGQPSLNKQPYLARYFLRLRIRMPHTGHHAGGEEQESEQVGRSPNIIRGRVPAHRLLVQIGKMAVTDVFDTNAYANNPRTQFLNKAFCYNLAYDYAQDPRGYDLGATVAWINPNWAVRLGSFAMPTTAGGPEVAFRFAAHPAHGDQLQYDRYDLRVLPSPKPPMTVRLLAWRNVADMGSYRDALAAPAPGGMPDVTAVRHSGATKYGLALNFDQALADGGNTGLFGRLGWNDGATESFCYAECDRFISLGAQIAGNHWGRKDDRVGIAASQGWLSAGHRDYLAAGGLGFTLGDGRLSYAPEELMEAYYSWQVTKPLAVTFDFQRIANPGYNGDRGPVTVASVRAHMAF